MTTTDQPTDRNEHAAVWTGSLMIVWGGSGGGITGGRYDPTTDTWTATTTVNAPDNRSDPSQVWTGTDMIIWAGFSGSTPLGSRYFP
jgi:hypothetical protein